MTAHTHAKNTYNNSVNGNKRRNTWTNPNVQEAKSTFVIYCQLHVKIVFDAPEVYRIFGIVLVERWNWKKKQWAEQAHSSDSQHKRLFRPIINDNWHRSALVPSNICCVLIFSIDFFLLAMMEALLYKDFKQLTNLKTLKISPKLSIISELERNWEAPLAPHSMPLILENCPFTCMSREIIIIDIQQVNWASSPFRLHNLNMSTISLSWNSSQTVDKIFYFGLVMW